jgi:hypothetical protein
MVANVAILDLGSLELEYHCRELRRFLLSEVREQVDRIPLIRHILSDSRLKETPGFLEPGSPNWKNREYLLRKASTALEGIEKELRGRS